MFLPTSAIMYANGQSTDNSDDSSSGDETTTTDNNGSSTTDNNGSSTDGSTNNNPSLPDTFTASNNTWKYHNTYWVYGE